MAISIEVINTWIFEQLGYHTIGTLEVFAYAPLNEVVGKLWRILYPDTPMPDDIQAQYQAKTWNFPGLAGEMPDTANPMPDKVWYAWNVLGAIFDQSSTIHTDEYAQFVDT